MNWRPIVTITLLTVLASAAIHAAELPDGFRLEPVLTGLTEPSCLATTPDGRILIGERTTGYLRQVRGGRLAEDPLCTLTVNASGNAGLLGIAMHPSFLDSGWVYLYYSATGGNRVSRFTVGRDSCGEETVIVDSLGAGAGLLRNGGGLAFGPDGKLYVATGDAENGSSAQDDGSLQGKILRVNDDGSIPADNPTPGSLVFAKGVRDGRGISVHSAGNVYAADAGSDGDSTYDEANLVPAGGNLGWNLFTGDSGGTYDDPLAAWSPVIGARGIVAYEAGRFPDAASDGIDNDEDRYGPDLFPGEARVDDNGEGECLTSMQAGEPCDSDSDCSPTRFYEDQECEFRDDLAEYCPGGTPYSDDACGSSGTHGIDELDESYLDNLFLAAEGDDTIRRLVLQGSGLDQLFVEEPFLDSSFLPDCPTGWTGITVGGDDHLYLTATNGGGPAGGLYRLLRDEAIGPREVSPTGGYFPLTLDKGATAGEVVVQWEDLRSNALQPRDDGVDPQAPVREYTIWSGTLGSFTSHAPVAGHDGIAGAAVNDALRQQTVDPGSGDRYILVSARHANLNGTLGKNSSGVERQGFAVTDLCDTIGFHESPGYDMWKCGRDFTLVDEFGETHSLYELRGHVMMIDFTSPWCGPCNVEGDALEYLNQDYKDRGVKVLTVLVDEDDELYDFTLRPVPVACRNWKDRGEFGPTHTFPCWADTRPESGPQEAWPYYNAHSTFYPTNVILDSGLRVVYSKGGFKESEIRDTLDLLVGTDTCLP